MTSDTLDIRPGMDVFDSYQYRYIGTVVHVIRGGTGGGGGPDRPGPNPTGSEQAPANPTLSQEQDSAVQSTSPERRGERVLGEELGPVPTIGLGNSGPVRQSAGDGYATHPDSPAPNVTHMAVRPGRLNLGILTPVVYVPVNAVQCLSMERVVVEVGGETIPDQWRRRPE